MFHEPYGIQQEGRLFQIAEEAKSQSAEHGKGSRRKVGKNTSWKYRSTCQNCGVEFAGRPGAPNRFCQNACQHEFSVNRWLACSKCHALVGFGCKTSAKILGIVNSTNITRKWRELGVVAQRPESGSWKAEIGIIGGKPRLTDEERFERKAKAEYQRCCLNDIKAAARGFDWSYLWAKESARRAMKERYRSFTEDEKREWNSKWRNRDKNTRRQSLRRWKADRRASDPIYRIIEGFRSRLSIIAKSKSEHTRKLIGCSSIQLRTHLESQFTKRMSWQNYGTYWHVDHILPCASFDHTDPKQVAQCWHWTNLRPLEAKKNIAKKDKITEPQMQLLLCATH